MNKHLKMNVINTENQFCVLENFDKSKHEMETTKTQRKKDKKKRKIDETKRKPIESLNKDQKLMIENSKDKEIYALKTKIKELEETTRNQDIKNAKLKTENKEQSVSDQKTINNLKHQCEKKNKKLNSIDLKYKDELRAMNKTHKDELREMQENNNKDIEKYQQQLEMLAQENVFLKQTVNKLEFDKPKSDSNCEANFTKNMRHNLKNSDIHGENQCSLFLSACKSIFINGFDLKKIKRELLVKFHTDKNKDVKDEEQKKLMNQFVQDKI